MAVRKRKKLYNVSVNKRKHEGTSVQILMAIFGIYRRNEGEDSVMSNEEKKNLLRKYDEFTNRFRTSEFVVEGTADKIREIIIRGLQDEIIIPEKDA